MITVREAENRQDMEAVWRLTHDTYVAQGYAEPQPDGLLIHYPHLDCLLETTVLVAVEDGEIVGTNSLTLDGPRGLHVDEDFKAECDRIRAEGRRLCASWRIATKSTYRGTLKLVKGLIQETVSRVIAAECLTCVFTFNPRHERIYKRLLNMRTVARRGGSINGLNNAPAVFMRWDLESCPDTWLRTAEERARRDSARKASTRLVAA